MVALAHVESLAQSMEIAPWRLNLLRSGYFIMAAGMGSIIVPAFLHHRTWTFTHGVMNAMLLAMVLLALLGLRYPLKMLPLIFWEKTWKAAWLLDIALPARRNGALDGDITANLFPCALAAIFPFIVPWDYVWRAFAASPAERWR